MKLAISDFPCPFVVFSNKYGQSREKWEKLYRTGYLWREYDEFELQEYMQVLTGYKPSIKVIKSFINQSNIKEELRKLKNKGQTTYEKNEFKSYSLLD